MSITLWGAWQSQWLSNSKVDFDGLNKLIIVHPEVTSLDIRSEVYSSWINWMAYSGDNQKWPFAMRYSGMDALPGGGESGGVFFTTNGWKLVIDFNKVAVTGVLFSQDYATAYWSASGQPLFPATVSALVNNAVSYQNVVTGVALNAQEIRQAVWDAPVTGLSTTGSIGEFISKKLLTLAKFIGLK
jgi:hypothetical protein